MSTNANVATRIMPVRDTERAHRIRLIIGYILGIALIAGLTVYGFDYYTLSSANRPFSPKHVLLKPSGPIGVKLGVLGLIMFLAIFLYPLRKCWPWLSRQGSSRHWLDIHVLLGLSAPFIIAFHSSFKFRGFAGMAFWFMLAVALSGVVGRYLYAQIPRSLNTAELSLRELQELQIQLLDKWQCQELLPKEDLQSLWRLPSAEVVQKLSSLIALGYMMALDVGRGFRIATLRRHGLGWIGKVATLGGFLPTRNAHLEKAVQTARQEAAIAKRVLFLGQAQRVFHFWHIVHRPFSYTFALLALIHLVVVAAMGYL